MRALLTALLLFATPFVTPSQDTAPPPARVTIRAGQLLDGRNIEEAVVRVTAGRAEADGRDCLDAPRWPPNRPD